MNRLGPQRYRLNFDIEAYATASGQPVFFPTAAIVFDVKDASQHYHVPLVLNPYSYSTYRGT